MRVIVERDCLVKGNFTVAGTEVEWDKDVELPTWARPVEKIAANDDGKSDAEDGRRRK